MKTRDFLQKQSVKLKTVESVKQYKKFKNFVCRIQKMSFNSFHSNKITKNFKNKKKLWETMGEIDLRKRLTKNGTEVRGEKEIVNCLNNHFNSIGHTMAEKIHNPRPFL